MNRDRPPPDLRGLVDLMDDDAGLTDEQVAEDLRAAGVDLVAATKRLDTILARVTNARKRTALDRARTQRTRHAGSDRREAIRAQHLPMEELRGRIARLAGRVAHRDLEDLTREDLESQLADLLDISED
jgi:hypothetical protein